MKTTEKYLNECFRFESLKNSIESQIDNSLTTKGSYLNFFADYVEFNYVFAGCVSSLAGKFHVSPSIEDCPVLKKVSHLVAKNVFEAAIDEYKDITHKSMSRIMMDQINEFYGVNSDVKSAGLRNVLKNVRDGYGMASDIRFDSLAMNLGFHIASEQLASFEFSYLDKKIQKDHSELYSFLNRRNPFRSWIWVEIHGEGEEEHAEFAYNASDLIVNELEGEDRENFLVGVKMGFQRFIEVQTQFFNITKTSLELCQ